MSDVGTGDRGLFGVNDESGPFGEVGAAVDEGSDEMSVDGAWAAERPSQAHLPGFIEVPWTPSVDLDCWLDAMGSVSTRARAEAIARQLGVGSSPPPYRVHSHRTDGISEAELDAAVSSAAVCSKNDPFYGAPECARASEDSVEVVEELVRAWLLDAMPGPATIQLMGDCREYWKAEAAVELASTGLDPQDVECAATELIEAFLRFYRASYDASQAATPAASSELVEDAARDLFIDSTLGTMIYCSLDRAEVKAITGIDPDTIPGG